MDDGKRDAAAELVNIATEAGVYFDRLVSQLLSDDLLLYTFGPTAFDRATEARVRGWNIVLELTTDETRSPVVALVAARGLERATLATKRKPVAN